MTVAQMLFHSCPGVLELLEKHTPSKRALDELAVEWPELTQYLPPNLLFNCGSENNVGRFRHECLHAPNQREDSTSGVVGARGNNLAEGMRELMAADPLRAQAMMQVASTYAEKALRNPGSAQKLAAAVSDIQAMTEEGMARMENQQAVAEQRAATTAATMLCSLCLTRESYEPLIANQKELRPAIESGAISPSMQQAWLQLAKIGESAAQTRARTAIARLKQTPEALSDNNFCAAARGLKGVSSAKVDIVFTCLRDMMDILRKHRGAAPIDWNHPARADMLKRKVDTDLLAALA